MNRADFDWFCRLVHSRSGLVLNESKEYLVRSRLEPLAREAVNGSLQDLLISLREDNDEQLIVRCVEAMATHESLFFRDTTPYDELAAVVLPTLAATRSKDQPLRIWSSACSSGQEPYSIAITLVENRHVIGNRRIEIIGSDLSETILHKARAGIYSDFEVDRGLSKPRLEKWFRRHGDHWQACEDLRAMVTFRPHNLLQRPAGLGLFDIVFCRNVLIYFDGTNKTAVLNHIRSAMLPDAALLLGSTESPMGVSEAFTLQPGTRTIFRQRDLSAQLRSAG